MSEVRFRTPSLGMPVSFLILLGVSTMAAVVFGLLWASALLKNNEAQKENEQSLAKIEFLNGEIARISKNQPKVQKVEPAVPASPVVKNEEPQIGGVSPSEVAAVPDGFEPTNLKMQHAVAVELQKGGPFQKILLDLPVMAKSRQLRWSRQQVERARQLSSEISAWRDKSAELYLEGQELLRGWDELVVDSMPIQFMQADSVSLPSNRQLISEEAMIKAAEDPVESLENR